jgi:hypothetical protein
MKCLKPPLITVDACIHVQLYCTVPVYLFPLIKNIFQSKNVLNGRCPGALVLECSDII